MLLEIEPKGKFFLEDKNDGSLILVSAIDFNPESVKNNFLTMRGTRFDVNYEDETVEKAAEVHVVVSFQIEGIYQEEPK